jgi:hypothetical protein
MEDNHNKISARADGGPPSTQAHIDTIGNLSAQVSEKMGGRWEREGDFPLAPFGSRAWGNCIYVSNVLKNN